MKRSGLVGVLRRQLWCWSGLLALLTPAGAAPVLNITPITWDFVGLDSNKPTVDGPYQYPVGARVCNVGDETAATVSATFRNTASSPYFSLIGGIGQLSAQNLAPGPVPDHFNRLSTTPANCTDFYFNIQVSRTKDAHNATYPYYIEATGTSAAGTVTPTVRTPTNRQLYVEKIISQNRNDVQSVLITDPGNSNLAVAPGALVEGRTYTFTLNATTAPGGYEQLEAFLLMPNTLFQTLSVSARYSTPTGATNSAAYADACGWVSDTTSAAYHNNLSCSLPDYYAGGKAGDVISTVYTIRTLSPGSGTVSNTILDYSGSSFHYAMDPLKDLAVTVSGAPDLTIDKAHTGTFTAGGSGIYTLKVANVGQSASSGTITVTDTLPSGLTPTAASGSGWNCTVSGQQVTCTTSAALNAVSGGAPTISVAVTVGTALSGTVDNTARVSGGGEVTRLTGNNSDIDSVTINQPPVAQAVSAPPMPNTNAATAVPALQATDPDGTVTSYTVLTLPPVTAGVLSLSGVPVTAGQSLTPAQAAALQFDPLPTYTGTATWTYGATDNLGGVSGAATYSLPVTAPLADLTLSKSGPGYAKAGAAMTYTLTVVNAGTAPAQGVTVRDPLPAGTTLVSASGGGVASTSGGVTTVTWTLGTLAAGQSTTLTVALTAPSEATVSAGTTSLSNTATTSTTSAEATTANNTSNTVTTRLVLVTLAKRVRNLTQSGAFGTAGTGRPGEVLEYCIDYRNAGGVDLPSFVVKDPVPANVTAVGSAYDAEEPSTATGFGIRFLRGTVTSYLTSAADGDVGQLLVALQVTLGTLQSGEAGSVCFQARIQ
ncbi:hypothetical protein [Deinococcus hohokamensis]|uniref:DUF11 domain-containing protein n=1 Tax=Deinococcus hohokamensis TaxID=309883 RepID=A0ABV9IB04_9DEIO